MEDGQTLQSRYVSNMCVVGMYLFLCVCGSDEKETSKYISVHFTPHIKQLNVVLVLRLSW